MNTPQWFLDNCTNGTDNYIDSWTDDSVRLMFHLGHWLPDGSWTKDWAKKDTGYLGSKGDIGKIMYLFLMHTNTLEISYAENVDIWERKYIIADLIHHILDGRCEGRFNALWPATYELEKRPVPGHPDLTRVYIKDTNKYLTDCMVIPAPGIPPALTGKNRVVMPVGDTIDQHTKTETVTK
jgi:hypothetical protein